MANFLSLIERSHTRNGFVSSGYSYCWVTKLKWRQQRQRQDQSNHRQPLRHQHSLCLQNLKATQKKHLVMVKSQRSPSSSLMLTPQEFTTTGSAWKSIAMTFPKKSIIESKSKMGKVPSQLAWKQSDVLLSAKCYDLAGEYWGGRTLLPSL